MAISWVVTPNNRRTAFYVFVAFVVSYIRYVIQYGEYWYNTVSMVFVMWFVHYIVLMIGAGIYSVVLSSWRAGLVPNRAKLDTDDVFVQFCAAALIIAVAIFVFYHFPAIGEFG